MDGFTIVDGIVALVVIISGLLAYSRGFVRETTAIFGWIISAFLAFIFAPQVETLVKEIPMIGDYLRESCELAIITAFAAVFAISLVVASIFTPLISSMVRQSALNAVDRSLGFFFGILRGLLLVGVVFLIYDRVVTGDRIAAIAESSAIQAFEDAQSSLDDQMPSDAPGWLLLRYEQLVGDCAI